MSIAYETATLFVEIVPACTPAERTVRRKVEPQRRAAAPQDLPAGVHAIGDVLPLVLAQMGLRVS